ncbi:hypothetical protein GCM10009613_51870 [Pseudonocardia kongjuensis]|uniref:Uncharacterized protein n=1 Tax=Pseudonocardia kongjuensis TaxID=102227 RepID=A0ABN1Y502_9PSEU
MNIVVRAILAGLVVALLAAGGGAALAVTTLGESASAVPGIEQVIPASGPTLRLPSASAADAVTEARAAVDTAQAETDAEAAAQEQAQREYAEHLSIGDNAVGPNYCDPYTGMHLDGTPCSSGQVQYEYWMNPGEAALQACREQTGMTTAECQADAAAGNAN